MRQNRSHSTYKKHVHSQSSFTCSFFFKFYPWYKKFSDNFESRLKIVKLIYVMCQLDYVNKGASNTTT